MATCPSNGWGQYYNGMEDQVNAEMQADFEAIITTVEAVSTGTIRSAVIDWADVVIVSKEYWDTVIGNQKTPEVEP